jgi:hypothetical protein
MMLEEELKKAKILTNIGAFSVIKGNWRCIDSLKFCAEILEDPNNMLLLLPQGEIQSIYTSDFVFETGALSYILKKKKTEFQILFNINLIDYSSKRKPEISVYFDYFTPEKNYSVEDIETYFNQFVKKCLKQQLEA